MIRNNASLVRQTFDALKKAYPGKEVSPHYLRVEAVLKNNTSKYVFNHRSLGTESATEKKLDRNDMVYVNAIGLGWICCKDGEEATAKIHTFAPTAVNKDLQAIYNGFFSLKTGPQVNFEALPCKHFEYVPRTQFSSVNATDDEYNVQDACYAGVEDIKLHGTKSHEMTVEIPTISGMQLEPTLAELKALGLVDSTVTTLPTGFVNKLVLCLYGFIVKNGADNLNK